MPVFLHFELAPEAFALGEILDLRRDDERIQLETLVPISERVVPLFRRYGATDDGFERRVNNHPAVAELTELESTDGERLYSLRWERTDDVLLEGIREQDGQLLRATGRAQRWAFEARFPSYDALSEFRKHCDRSDVSLEVNRVYTPEDGESAGRYGLTECQRDTLKLAVERGYYDVPRSYTTRQLAEELEISDQAVTERLRRAVRGLTENTLLAAGCG